MRGEDQQRLAGRALPALHQFDGLAEFRDRDVLVPQGAGADDLPAPPITK